MDNDCFFFIQYMLFKLSFYAFLYCLLQVEGRSETSVSHETPLKLVQLFSRMHGSRHKLIPSLLSPYSWGQQDVAVVLEVVNGAAAQHDVCQDVAPEAVEHGAEPRGHGAAAGDLHRACKAHWEEAGGGCGGRGGSSLQHTMSIIQQSTQSVIHR